MPFETFPVEILQTTSEFFKNSNRNSDRKSSQLHILTGYDSGQLHVCVCNFGILSHVKHSEFFENFLKCHQQCYPHNPLHITISSSDLRTPSKKLSSNRLGACFAVQVHFLISCMHGLAKPPALTPTPHSPHGRPAAAVAAYS